MSQQHCGRSAGRDRAGPLSAEGQGKEDSAGQDAREKGPWELGCRGLCQPAKDLGIYRDSWKL